MLCLRFPLEINLWKSPTENRRTCRRRRRHVDSQSMFSKLDTLVPGNRGVTASKVVETFTNSPRRICFRVDGLEHKHSGM